MNQKREDDLEKFQTQLAQIADSFQILKKNSFIAKEQDEDILKKVQDMRDALLNPRRNDIFEEMSFEVFEQFTKIMLWIEALDAASLPAHVLQQLVSTRQTTVEIMVNLCQVANPRDLML